MAYEYTAVLLTAKLTKGGGRKWADQINAVAILGWRLVTIDDSMAVFERQTPGT